MVGKPRTFHFSMRAFSFSPPRLTTATLSLSFLSLLKTLVSKSLQKPHPSMTKTSMPVNLSMLLVMSSVVKDSRALAPK